MISTCRILLLLFLFASILPDVFSKNNFVKGFIITNSNDTIDGYIDYVIDECLSKFCVFKQNINAGEEEV